MDLVFPPSCLICEREVTAPYSQPLYCEACLAKIVIPRESACRRCSARLPFQIQGDQKTPMVQWQETADGCLSCKDRRWNFKEAYSVGAYQDLLRDHVYQLKRPYQSTDAFHAGMLLGHLLLLNDAVQAIDFLVPVPSHWRRWLSRGFNPAQEIAAGISQVTGTPVLPRALHQIRLAQKQGTLTAAGRHKNVKSNMKLGAQAQRVTGKRIMIIDDVMTTGSTLSVCSQLLTSDAQARQISVAVVARATLA